MTISTIRADKYPSRCSARPAIRARRDPVVYGLGGRDDALAQDQVSQYERDGFLHFERFLAPAAVEALQAGMDQLWHDADPSDPGVIAEPDSRTIRSIFDVHRRSRPFDQLARDPRILAIVQQILGGRVYVHQSRINYKRGFDGREFYWHSDFETWHVEDGMPRMRAVSLSIALSDNSMLNGPLMLIPGSHRHYVACVGATPEEHFKTSLRRQEYGVPDPESLAWLVDDAGGIAAPAAPAGSMILFDCNLMHGSNSNITPFARSNLFIVYNSIDNRLERPFGGRSPRPRFVAAREAEPLVAHGAG